MDNKQQTETAQQYLRRAYSFALAKTSTPEDAQDLAQDILLHFHSALQKSQPDNPEGYFWRIARNLLADYYRGKTRSGYGYMPTQEFPDPAAAAMQDEQHAKLFGEIARLHAHQREILLLYYYEGRKQPEIAQMLSLPVGTVKWHLFQAKKELKKGMETMRDTKELKFNPIRFTIMGANGSLGSMGNTANFFRSQLSQNIAYCAYRTPKTTQEIADDLGVSRVYVESEAAFLAEYGFLVQKNGKYLANLLISEANETAHSIAAVQQDMYERAAALFAPRLLGALSAMNFTEEELYSPGNDKNFLLWSLFFYVAALSGEALMPNSITFEEAATRRPDGGHNIASAGFSSPNGPNQKYFESILQWCGPCWNQRDNSILWCIDSEWSEKRVTERYSQDAQKALSLITRYVKKQDVSGDEYAYLAQQNYLYPGTAGSNEGLSVVWIKNEKAQKRFLAIGDAIKAELFLQLNELKAPFVQAVMQDTPSHLKKAQAFGMQYLFFSDGWFLLYCAKELLGSSKLLLPTKEQRKSLSTVFITK